MKRSQSNPSRLLKRRSFRGWLKRATLPSSPKKVVSNDKDFVFGIPLTSSINYANTSVGYIDEDGVKHSRAGSVPIVVAKCGSFLKQQGTDIFKKFAYINLLGGLGTEGIFRVPGSVKRVNDLEFGFDSSATHYGLDLSWEGYTVHDAANLLTRYLSKLPNSVIPFESYQEFRSVLTNKSFCNTELKVEAFQSLIRKLPIAHRHLLLYLLDLLSLFSLESEQTKMPIPNLAAIFCASLLRHPNHNSPDEYKVSQYVIEFLVEYQDSFTLQVLNRVVQVSSPEELSPSHTFRDIPAIKSAVSLPTLPKNALAKTTTNPVGFRHILAVSALFLFLYEICCLFTLRSIVEPFTVLLSLFSYYVLLSAHETMSLKNTGIWPFQVDEPLDGPTTHTWISNDKTSILSSISRYSEEDFNDQEEEEDDLDFDMDSAILEKYLLQYDQIKKDAELAKKLQHEEQKARDLNNPFINSNNKPDNKIVA